MGWGTQFTADIYISRERFANEYELDSKIEELKDYIQIAKEKILMACMNGKDAFSLNDCEGNECDAVDVIHSKVSDMIQWLLECNEKLYQYELLKEKFDNRENV